MRNLKLVDSQRVNSLSAIYDGQFLTVDQDIGTVYVATPQTLIAFSAATKEVLATISLEGDTNPDVDSAPVGLQYLFDQQSVCVATRDGRLCLWQINSPELECVGEVEQGITDMAWSPDMELLVITTGKNTLIIMTREFDAITEVPIIPMEFGEENPITVGWGKKETQFHGSAGKDAAKVKNVKVHPAGPLDHKKPVVRWRGDGQFFVVSAIEPQSGARFLYTWSRECVFQSVSEPVDGLQHSLFWKPSGSLIASVQTNIQKVQEIIFFEKNGLRHGEFRIPNSTDSNIFVRSLSWNQDSSVLAICYDEIDETSKKSVASVLQLWTVNNYHWYLKQNLRFSEGLSVFNWDPEQFCRLMVITQTGTYLSYTWAWTTSTKASSRPDDLASVCVIDGDKLLVTPMRTMVVPPPMAAFTLSHPEPVNYLTFNLSAGSNDIASLMSNGRVAFWKYQEREGQQVAKLDAAGGEGFIAQCLCPALSALAKIEGLDGLDIPLTVTDLLWLNDSTMIISTIDSCAGSVSFVHTASVSIENKSIIVKNSMPLESHMVTMAATPDASGVVIQLANGELLKLTPDTQSLLPFECNETDVSFPYPCTQMMMTNIDHKEVVLGLTERFRFYVNDLEVASNCTSFFVHNDFLLLTTLSHTARCISKSTKLSDLSKLSDGKAHPFDESIRRVERGSKIVTAVGDDTKLVLQMPRGNLETIHPRALILSTLKRLLECDKIHESFVMMRKHRINMNLFYDHNPSHFIDNIDQFVSQIQSVNHLNLFLTDLIEEDVTRTMYTASYQRNAETESEENAPKSKVDLICDAALAAFKRLDEDKYMLCIITAHVRKTTPALEEALLLVWSLNAKPAASGGVSGEEALKYLLFLVDVNDLYDVALGTYNFDLVMMVAHKSQKDPKEYIPFLNSLRQLDETYRRYTIDKHLKRYSKALENISKCGDEQFEECMNLVTDHKLYYKALQLFTPSSSQYKSISAMYGAYLRSKNRHDEAGIMYIKAEEWESALEAFEAAHDWRQTFCMAARLEYSKNRITELAIKLAGNLKSRQRYAEAAEVFDQYAEDPEEAIAALIEGSHWAESLRLMHKHKRLDLVETHLKEALEESWEQQMETLSSQKEQFIKYRRRLGHVRAMKERSKLLLEGAAEYNDADADLFSDTTSMTGGSIASLNSFNSSRSTVFSKGSSGRAKRKAANKKWSLKEGSMNEEYALVDALAQIIKITDSLKEETNSLMKSLIQFNYDTKASQLQDLLGGFITEIQSSLSTIWIYNAGGNSPNLNLGPQTTASAIAQAMQTGHMPQGEEEKLDPVLLVPPPLNKDIRWKLHMASDDEK